MGVTKLNKNDLQSAISKYKEYCTELDSSVSSISSVLSSIPSHNDFSDLTSAASLIASSLEALDEDSTTLSTTMGNYINAIVEMDSEEVSTVPLEEVSADTSVSATPSSSTGSYNTYSGTYSGASSSSSSDASTSVSGVDDELASSDSDTSSVAIEEVSATPVPDEITLDDVDVDEVARNEWESQFTTESEYDEYINGLQSDFDKLYGNIDSSKLKSELTSLGLSDEQITDIMSVDDISYVRQRLQDYGVDDTTIEQIVANVLDQSDLIAKLKEFGYNDAEIASLLDNKSACMNAYVAGVKSSELSSMAKSIASSNNISDFESSYDDDPDYAGLSNGDANAFIANTTLNDDLKEMYDSVTESRETYEKAVVTANESIVAATAAKTVLANLDSTYGSDTSKWSSEQVSSYNEAVKAYNEAVSKANTDSETASSAKESYEKAKSEYTTAKDKYLYEIKERDALNNIMVNDEDETSVLVSDVDSSDEAVLDLIKGNVDEILAMVQE